MTKFLRVVGNNYILMILFMITSLETICEYNAMPNPSDVEVALYFLSIVSFCMSVLLLVVMALNKLKANKK